MIVPQVAENCTELREMGFKMLSEITDWQTFGLVNRAGVLIFTFYILDNNLFNYLWKVNLGWDSSKIQMNRNENPSTRGDTQVIKQMARLLQ